MSANPTVYIFHGDDAAGIEEAVASLKSRLGDPATADMNTSRFSGKTEPGALRQAIQAVPFIASRRLVLLEGLAANIRSQQDKQDFTEMLGSVPETTAAVVIEARVLKADHWLLTWAGQHAEKVYLRAMALPRGGELVKWVVQYARKAGGEIAPQAAQHLVSLVGDDNRAAASETDKLLAYVNYNRPIEIDDVDLLTAPVQFADVFRMVDALGARNGRLALTMLHDLLGERDGISMFGMVLRQFRLILLYKSAQEQNLAPAEAARRIGVQPFVASKIANQARNFSVHDLEAIYSELGEIDDRIKSGQVDVVVALDAFVAGVTSRA